MIFAPGSLLAQILPTGTAATACYTATVRTEITRIDVCNVTSSAATYDLYHDDAAAGFAVGNALRYGKSVAANTGETPVDANPGAGLQVKAGGKIGVRSGTGSALAFSVYGVIGGTR